MRRSRSAAKYPLDIIEAVVRTYKPREQTALAERDGASMERLVWRPKAVVTHMYRNAI